jgi:predicted membrane protein (TIGR00267 family)
VIINITAHATQLLHFISNNQLEIPDVILSKNRFSAVLSRGLPYLINTLFDVIFTILGIVVGNAFGSVIDTRAIIGTMVTASISLGVSSGFSVYEAESIQEEKRIDQIEEALLTDLEGTMITEESRAVTIFSALLVFLTPLFACMITLIPFAFVLYGIISIERSILYTVLIDLSLIFLSGLAFGGEKRIFKGIRMTILGTSIFIIGFLLNRIV